VSTFAIAEKFIEPEVDWESVYDEIPAAIRAELNADSDRDILVRMSHLARKKRMRQPNITDEQMADYLALAENYTNFDQWSKLRHQAAEPGPSGSLVAWALGTLAIVGILTTGLIAAIAISVAGL
jgi:hypothetical protein